VKYILGGLGSQSLCFGDDLIDVADHVEGHLGQVVVLPLQNLLEPGDGLLNGDQLAGVVREHLRNLQAVQEKIILYITEFLSDTGRLYQYP
jgi:hypothetical protein